MLGLGISHLINMSEVKQYPRVCIFCKVLREWIEIDKDDWTEYDEEVFARHILIFHGMTR